MLCAVLVRELLWLEARMDDQALFEGIVVFSDEDGPGKKRKELVCSMTIYQIQILSIVLLNILRFIFL